MLELHELQEVAVTMSAIPLRWIFPCLMVVVLLLAGPCGACGPGTTPERPPDVERRPPGLTEVYSYTDGIEVQVSDLWTGRLLGVPVVELAVTLRNGSPHTFEALLGGELRYGPHRRLALRYDSLPWPDERGSMQLVAIGEQSEPYQLSFVVPPSGRDDLELDLAIDTGAHEPAVFAGAVTE
jgi:hypothetical protein